MFETNEAALRAAVAAFNDPHDRAGYLNLYDPDVVLHGYPRGLAGLDGARTFYSELWEAFPDARLTVEEVIGSDDRVAARYRLSGIQAREFYGAPSTGEATKVQGIAWLRFRDGRAVEVWQASGTLDTLTRLTARAAQGQTRPSASAEAAALRWDERHADA
ncbi:MAG TPA: ester cyclase [Solirubrobacteraceae bacterium]